MRTIFTILFVAFFQLAFAQVDSVAKEIKAEKITKRAVRGKYVYLTPHGRISLKVRPAKHFRRRGLTYFGWTISRGKWKIQNDTLLLIEKSYREEPFSKRMKVDTDTLRFIMSNGSLLRIETRKGKEEVYGTYITKKAWRKIKRSRRQRWNPFRW
jgi:hypothetical protein